MERYLYGSAPISNNQTDDNTLTYVNDKYFQMWYNKGREDGALWTNNI